MSCEKISICLVLIFLLLRSCTSTSIITPDKPLRDGQVLVSAGEHFKLGFFSPHNTTRRYVGIWYNKVSVQTVVWVANRDHPINHTFGVLSLNTSGTIGLFDSRKPDAAAIWCTNISNLSSVVKSSYSAELLDTGNLVVHDNDSKKGFIWQSFDYPTDTLLSNMKIGVDLRSGLNRVLTSWKSEDDPGTGSYSLMIDLNGTLPQLFLYKNWDPLWRGGPWNGLGWSGVPGMGSPDYVLSASYVENSEEVYLVDYIRNPSFISRMTVNESTGTLQRLTWQEDARKWINFYSAPKDQCDRFSHCGAYGDCSFNMYSVGEYECKCAPGFEPKSSYDWYLRDGSQGCSPKRQGQLCGKGEGFIKLARMKLPDTTKTRRDKNLSLDECTELCLKNCSCTGYSAADVRGGGFNGCITWYSKLVDLREFPSGGQDFYLRVDAVELANSLNKSKKFHDYIKVLVPVSLSAALLLLLTTAYCLRRKKKIDKARRRQEGLRLSRSSRNRKMPVPDTSVGEESSDIETTTVDVKLFPLSTIIFATENFSLDHKIGQGGFGSVYKGKLRSGQEIAVKRLSNTSGQGIEEFRNEVTLIARLQHRNLVRLFGYCVQKEEKMLIYEYLPNKGLDEFLFDNERRNILDWKKRFDIALGIARGMVYLHHDSRLKIIHRDLKASNVLLDSELNPKISDFGMARIFKDNKIQEATTRVVGTYGYMSPEYAMDGLFSRKSDVFSFGVLLLEIITGRKNSSYHSENCLNIIGHVWDLWNESRVLEIVDESLGESSDHDHEMFRCIHIGLLCVQESATARPSMSEVLSMLSNQISLPAPGQVAFILRTSDDSPANMGSRSVGVISINDVTISTVEGR
ncbi:G-type lectin S-receptor-like serine/threonine-protein kinase RKS1 [Daucus carota subsp. sativus]|uniref:G-type lectin S-receptor-like serine/threonine-protein kinase RKS1 n=1 Tax=Daucus carota subsp. sativus TaxID=79200 RepID=UPI0007EF1964|nr:PREDICTED: G-type lectin S-receptor-like serine/threonine-protein kinase RKS1 [Daucus carota subsp. sativus]